MRLNLPSSSPYVAPADDVLPVNSKVLDHSLLQPLGDVKAHLLKRRSLVERQVLAFAGNGVEAVVETLDELGTRWLYVDA